VVERKLLAKQLPSLKALYDSDWGAFSQLETISFHAGYGRGGAVWNHGGTGYTPTTDATIYATLGDGYIVDQGGNRWDLSRETRVDDFVFGARANYDPATLLGDDDTAANQAMFSFVSDSMDNPLRSIPVFWGPGVRKISGRLDVPPGVHIFGAGMYSGTSASAGTMLCKTHDGVLLRFVRSSAGVTLYHNGALRYVTLSGGGSADTVASRLVELGDADNVDTNNGAWCGIIEACGFNSSYGYGVYSAHSQSWKIINNFYRNVRYAVWYETVAASAVISGNEMAFTNAGLNGYGVVLLRGTLGGAVGACVSKNYMISPKVGVWLSNQIGAQVEGNTIEGAKEECIVMDRRLPSGVADVSESVTYQNGCKQCKVDQNSFINWNADGGSKAAIRLSYSRGNYIGLQAYASPNGASPACIALETDGTDPCKDNVIVQPVVQGNNAGVVPAFISTDAAWRSQVVIRQDGFKLGLNAYTGVRGAADEGHMFFDADGNARYWDGAASRRILMCESALAGSAGAQTAWLRIKIAATNYKLPLYLDS
jgi:hypothetical protein